MASQYRRRSLMLNTIAKVAQGNPTIITDSSSRRLQKLNIYGQSSQDGTPSVENPIPIISKEVSEIKVTNGADLSQTITLTEPITLRGIPVESGGNVTIDGQQYVSDVICEKDGVIGVERNCYPREFKVAEMDGSEEYPGWNNVEDILNFAPPNINKKIPNKYICNIDNKGEQFLANTMGSNKIFILGYSLFNMTQSQIKEQYPDLIIKLVFQRLTPTFEPLPEEIQTQYKALKSYYPNTVIQTGCWNEVAYSAKRGG
nr:MAG TPA: hypothetical protein [Caudoviricetes sp.]